MSYFQGSDSSDDAFFRSTVIVPFAAVGKVIGRGGRTIEEISKSTKCKLEFRRIDAADNGDTPLRITSRRESLGDISAAEKLIDNIVSFLIPIT